MKRSAQIILITTMLCWSWLGMQVFHELGHVIGGLVSGAEIHKVYLHPLTLSRTVFAANSKPLLVLWAGPVLGVTIPFLLYLAAAAMEVPRLYLFRFFSGFCFIANGIYMTFGFNLASLDSGVMLTLETPILPIICFGVITIPSGLYLWHNQGRYFGFGRNRLDVAKEDAHLSSIILISLVIAEVLFSLL